MDDDFFAATAAPDEGKLASIEEMVAKAMSLSQHISELENALKAVQKDYRQIVEKDLVERLLEAKTLSFTTDMGLVVSIEKTLIVSELKSDEKKRELAERRAKWLEENGGESLIKENVEMVFDKGSHERALKAMQLLQSFGYDFYHGHAINTNSFKAFVKDVMHEEDVPLDTLGLYQKTEAVIEVPQQPVERKSRRRA